MRTINRSALSNCTIPLLPHQKYVAVALLSGETVYFVSEVKGRCQTIFDQVCNYLGLNDTELFSLALKYDEEYVFVEQVFKLYKYAPKAWKNQDSGLDLQGKPLLTLHFRVHLYVDCHLLISEKITRQLYYLQLKENVCKYCQAISEDRAFLLAALALQADMGNFQNDKHAAQYFDPKKYFNALVICKLGEKFIRKHTPSLHKDNTGLSRGEAQVNFIKEASNETAQHNLHFYKMKRKKGKAEDVWLGISQMMLQIYEDNGQLPKTKLSNFFWSDITKIHFEKKKFEICCAGVPKVRKFTYYIKNEVVSKSLFWLCRLTHQFNMAVQPRVLELKKYELEATIPFRESYIYSDSSELRWFGSEKCVNTKLTPLSFNKKELIADSNQQRKSVISNSSSNTTSGIVSDRDKVHSFYESEDELDAVGTGTMKNGLHYSENETFANGKVRSASGDGGFFEFKNSKKSKSSNISQVSQPQCSITPTSIKSDAVVNGVNTNPSVQPIEVESNSCNQNFDFKVPIYQPKYFVYEEKDIVNGTYLSSKAASVLTLPSPCLSENIVNSAINCNVQYPICSRNVHTVSLHNRDSVNFYTGVQTLNRIQSRNVTRIGVSSLTKGRTARAPLSLYSSRQAGSEPELNHLRTWSSTYSVDSEHSLPPNMAQFYTHRHSLADGYLLGSHTGPSFTWKSNTSIPSSYSTLKSTKNFPISIVSSSNEIPPSLPHQNVEHLGQEIRNVFHHEKVLQNEVDTAKYNQTQSQLDIHQLWKKSQDMELPLLTALCNDRSLMMLPKTVATCSRQRHLGTAKDLRRFSCSYLNTSLDETPYTTAKFSGTQTIGGNRPCWPENQSWQSIKNNNDTANSFVTPVVGNCGVAKLRPHSLSAPNEMISFVPPPILTSFGKTAPVKNLGETVHSLRIDVDARQEFPMRLSSNTMFKS